MNTLIIQLMLLQVGVPLLLIGMHALVKVASMTGWWLRTLGITLLLVLVAQTGVWLFPPYWTPWALGVLLLLASAKGFRRYRSRSASNSSSSSTWCKISEIATALLLCAGMSALLLPAIEGRRVPLSITALSTPLESGRYLATSGGTTEGINSHLKTLQAERFAAYRGQSYAVDLISIDKWGFRTVGISPVDPTRYHIYGRAVKAPCTGAVSVAVDGVMDMPVPKMDRENMLGNHVIIHCQGVFVVLAHLAIDSVSVAAGDSVKTGDSIGAVGNSGNTADPHLHIHVQATLPEENPISAEPLWFTLNDRFLLRNDVLLIRGEASE